MIEPDIFIPFIIIIAFATYVQTVTGFALAMIVMGAVTSLELAPMAFTSVIISAVAVINGLTALKGNFSFLDVRRVAITCLGILPGVVLGLFLLNYMSAAFNSWLQILLGGTIISAGMMMMLKPEPLDKPSSSLTFAVCGAAGGLLAGLFSIAGPPLVYVFYRQPFELKTIRLCLMSLFLVSSIGRISIVGAQGDLTLDMLIVSLACTPAVMFFTWLGKHFPPPFSPKTMRQLAFLLLMIIGVILIIKNI
ncbi:MAG: sulfite exporter TauE/SafE family protein [Motiliproteus sp.]